MSGPPPPADLANRTAHLIPVDPGTTIHRFWILRGGDARYDPIYYDRTRAGRLNAPDASYGVLYTALTPTAPSPKHSCERQVDGPSIPGSWRRRRMSS